MQLFYDETSKKGKGDLDIVFSYFGTTLSMDPLAGVDKTKTESSAASHSLMALVFCTLLSFLW